MLRLAAVGALALSVFAEEEARTDRDAIVEPEASPAGEREGERIPSRPGSGGGAGAAQLLGGVAAEHVLDIEVLGSTLVVASGFGELVFYDVADPRRAQRAGSIRSPPMRRLRATPARDFLVGSHDWYAGLSVFDFTGADFASTLPRVLSRLDGGVLGGATPHLFGRRAYAAATDGSVRIFDLSTPEAPRLLWTVPPAAAAGGRPGRASVYGMAVGSAEQHLYVASAAGLLVYRLSGNDGPPPQLVHQDASLAGATEVVIAGGKLVAALAARTNQLAVMDLANPDRPAQLSALDLGWSTPQAVTAAGDHLYVTMHSSVEVYRVGAAGLAAAGSIMLRYPGRAVVVGNTAYIPSWNEVALFDVSAFASSGPAPPSPPPLVDPSWVPPPREALSSPASAGAGRVSGFPAILPEARVALVGAGAAQKALVARESGGTAVFEGVAGANPRPAHTQTYQPVDHKRPELAVALSDDRHAFVVGAYDGAFVFDTAALPAVTQPVAYTRDPMVGYSGVYIDGNVAVCVGTARAQALDVGSPAAVQPLSAAPLETGVSLPQDVAGVGRSVFIAVRFAGTLRGLDASDPSNLRMAGTLGGLKANCEARLAAGAGVLAYVCGGEVALVDPSDVDAPRLLATHRDALAHFLAGAISGQRLYVTDGFGALHEFDIAAPAAPVLVRKLRTSVYGRDIAVRNGQAVLTDGNFVEALQL